LNSKFETKIMIKSIAQPCIALLTLAQLSLTAVHTDAQSRIDPDSIRSKMQWFADAKLGIFIHWGIYAVRGTDESWAFYNNKIGWQDYMAQMKGFTAAKYDPEYWASLIAESGARYAVLTTKHHDGVALWGTKQKHFNVVDNTPANRDLLTPFFSAIRKKGIKAGAYFSLIDWSHPDYPGFRKDSTRYKIADDPARWQRYLTFMHAQLEEAGRLVNPDLWWFDGDWEHDAAEWESIKIRKNILARNPRAIINQRLAGYGDYDTPEQNFPVTRPRYTWWELCMTTNNNWGFQHTDTNWKSPYEIITIFADVVSNGGNLLLDIGPKEDGTIPGEQVHILSELGAWNKKHGEAIFGTQAGIAPGHYYGPTTLSADSTRLYMFLPGKVSGEIVVKGLNNAIRSITVLGEGSKLDYKIVGKISWSPVPGLVYIRVPEQVQDKYMTVLRIELDKPVSLYRGKGGYE
jgi:alpha-L-fucosidase